MKLYNIIKFAFVADDEKQAWKYKTDKQISLYVNSKIVYKTNFKKDL